MNIFALWGEIEINRKQAEQDIKSVEKQAESSGKQMETSFGKVTKVVGAMIKEVDKYGKKVTSVGENMAKKAGVPLAALTGLMGGLAKTTADYGDKMAKSAQEVGMTAVAYQELTYALGQNNLNAEESLRVFGRLNQRIGLARNGNEAYRKSLKKMGVDLDDLDKGLVGTEEAFGQIIEYLSEMEDSQLQAAYASDIFGTMLSRKMMPLIRSGAEGVDELRKRAHELGIVMDEEATRRAEQFGDTMSDLKDTMGGFNRSIGKELFAPLMNIANWMMDIISAGTEWVKENPKLVRQIIIWGGAIAGVLGVLVTLGTTLVITGKIIGALGTVMGILTSKPFLIIAAIGLLWLAWQSDWGNIRSFTEKVWTETLKPIIDAIIEWGGTTLKTVWNWTTETTSKFLAWVSETAWPWIGNSVSTAWNWATGAIGDFIAWIKDIALPWIGGTVSTAWEWTEGHLDNFVQWLYAQWGFIVNGLTTIWSWSGGYVDKFVTWIKDTAWPVITKGASTAWSWTVGTVDDFITWIKNVAWPWINGTVKTTWDWTVKGLDWVKSWFGPSEVEETASNVERLTGELSKLEKQALIIAEVMRQGGTMEQAMAILGIAYWETRRHGGYTHTDPATGEVMRGGAGEYGIGQVMPGTGKDVWTRLWKQPAETYDESMLKDLDTNIAMMVSYFLDRYRVHGEDLRFAIEGYNRGTAIDGMQAYTVGVVDWMTGSDGQKIQDVMYEGLTDALESWVQAGYDAEGDVRLMAAHIAQVLADYLVGQSPPPLGPLSVIDEGGANVMGAWIEGAEDGLKDGVPVLSSMLEKIRGLFGSIWDKVPEDIKAPIETAIGYIGGLIDQAEEALWKLDELEQQLGDALGTGGDPGGQAQGFMDRLTAGLNDKLDQLDAPMERFTNAVYQAGGTLFEFGKALASGNWLDAFLIILMETESFAKAMELLGAVLDPVIALFDAVLAPMINFLLKLWNGIIDALASISIFGWKPFGGLKDKKIGLVGEGDGGGGDDKGRGGRQVSEITGPTRDLLVDLLSPLANFGQVIAPVQDIRNILYERLPNFNNMDFAGAGAGSMGGVVFESGSIVIHSLATNSAELSRNLLDQIEREMARRFVVGQRGRGGR